ncbi:hypothetical protein DKM44_01855 [Deinococcus irradiatisoli]|uniref:Uncharacterized protein n=1 Tax=Deinococcus irradiatisoli TaxID=2202254 RepID=A0A2Z3JJM8_9DEIO|nr:hypothetical protein [Deinococcus irradiatisoli]AWN22138.1 hypothetical protein DKM44_01855 [Deinococcus irradiatisoli]
MDEETGAVQVIERPSPAPQEVRGSYEAITHWWRQEISLLGPLVNSVEDVTEAIEGPEVIVSLGHTPMTVRISRTEDGLRVDFPVGCVPKQVGALATLLAQNADGLWMFSLGGHALGSQTVLAVLETTVVVNEPLSRVLLLAWQQWCRNQGMLRVLRGEFDD